MDPVFTLQWPEFIVASRLQQIFPKRKGYCVTIPVSRQEKGIDLAVIKKHGNGLSKVATIQVKASKTYTPDPPKRNSTKRFKYYTWFNRFDVPEVEDFIFLTGLYAPDSGRTKNVTKTWYKNCIMVFTNKEMNKFIRSCRTSSGKPDKMFGFGFDDDKQIVQTRGGQNRPPSDFTEYLLEKRFIRLEEALKERP